MSGLKSVKIVWLITELVKFRHNLVKMLAFSFFGIGGLFLASLLFPIYYLIMKGKPGYQKILRRTISRFFRIFVLLMRALGLIRVEMTKYRTLSEARSTIICANHPSLIDVVIIISMVPEADCLVNASLWKNPFIGPVVKSVYIPNSTDVSATIEKCRDSLNRGNNVVIFPEGTRTKPGKPPVFRRSPAHIALITNRRILPVAVVCPDPIGLRKHDGIHTAPASGIIDYQIEVLAPINPQVYDEGKSRNISARILTKELETRIISRL